MLIGIHPDHVWGTSFSDKWIPFLKTLDVDVKILDLLRQDALDQVKGCDGVMWRWAHRAQDKQSAKMILYVIEQYLNLPVFPETRTSWHFDEKVAQKYLLQSLDVPLPDQWVFWGHEDASEWARNQAKYPVVFKLSVGAGASSVAKIDSCAEALAFIDTMFKRGIFPMTMNEFRHRIIPASRREVKKLFHRFTDTVGFITVNHYPRLDSEWWKPEMGYALFQEFLPNNDYDTRITVIGNRAFGFRRFNRANDFRASGSGNIDYNPAGIDLETVRIAFETSRNAGFTCMAYDFLYKDDKPVVCEISYTFADYAIHSCPGHWDSNLNWHDGQMWPEDAQIIDFIETIRRGRTES